MCLKTPTDRLDAFCPDTRRKALESLAARAAADDAARAGTAQPPDAPRAVNMHMHTFFSYNAMGCSPSRLAWLAKKNGLGAAGIVDFDVLDGLEEFLEAGRLLNLRTCAGIETRVRVPEFEGLEINSPGEPGIAYHMGVGMPRRALETEDEAFLDALRAVADRRNRQRVGLVNAFLAPVGIDYERDVLPRTPAGNPTERHLCGAYALKAAALMPDVRELAAFWAARLDRPVGLDALPDAPALLDTIRARTMKRGGPGYVRPDAASFPLARDMNAFVLRAGGIPCLAWLDGCSDGEQQMDELLDAAMAAGVRAVGVIPDRNFTPGVRDAKLRNLQAFMAEAMARDLPVLAGTEMNAPGQKFVDDFNASELKPYCDWFYQSACIVYAHTVLERHHGRGYLSDWARKRHPGRKERNAFFAHVGQSVLPGEPDMAGRFLERGAGPA